MTLLQVKKACMEAVRNGVYFPQAAEIRRSVFPSVDDAALLAWTGFNLAADAIGAYQSLDVEDGTAGAALVAVFGSWPEFCSQARDDAGWGARRNEFLASYRSLRRTNTTQGLLPGLCDHKDASEAILGRLWVGRLSASGAVSTARLTDRLALSHQRSPAQLTDGESD
jgi:hypothetical protein